MVGVEIDFGKGDFVWISLLVVLISVGFVVAYNSDWRNNPGEASVMGHSPDELGFDVYRFSRDNAGNYNFTDIDRVTYSVQKADCQDGGGTEEWCCDEDNKVCLRRDDNNIGFLQMTLPTGKYSVGCWLVHSDDDFVKEWSVGMDFGGEECKKAWEGSEDTPCFRVGNPGEAFPLDEGGWDGLAFICM